MLPDFHFETALWNKGIKFVAGCDEVGRGCFAGPVVASIVIFDPNIQSTVSNFQIKINDSKKLSKIQREKADLWIRSNALAFGIGKASVVKINKFGIVKATQIAMRLAIKKSKINIEHLLSDAFYIPYIKGISTKHQTPIIRGDLRSFSIASASIIAKVYRDKLMSDLGSSRNFRQYLWGNNKGYGTLEHRNAILKYGVTKHHRKQFVSTFLSKLTSNP
jgi:ribonuclease HII